jgi:hypothetical protein
MERIDRAIAEIKRASIDDRKDLNDHPPADPTWNRVGRIRKAAELLQSVERDLKFEEDNDAALGWRAAALQHTHSALDWTVKAMRDDRRRF